MNIYRLFGLIIVVLILLTGIFLIFSNYFNYIPKNIKIVLSFLIISYGSFRLVNIIHKQKESDEDATIE